MSSAPPFDPAVWRRIAGSCGFFRLRRAARVVTRRIETAFATEELTPHQLLMMGALEMSGAARVRDLADVLGLDHSTLSRTLTPLLQRGWIREIEGSDRRASLLEVTPAGRRHAEAAARSWERFQSSLEASLGPARWARLSKDLDALIALDEPAPSKPARGPRRSRR